MLVPTIKKLNLSYRDKASEYITSLAMPRGALGSLAELAIQIMTIQESMQPRYDRATVFVCAGDHGVAR